MHLSKLVPKLLELYGPGDERVGFIGPRGGIHEVKNVCEDPANGFEVRGADLIKHMGAAASWHTHPDQNSHLSTNDFYAFRAYPQMRHIIIGTDGVRIYRVTEGVIEIEEHLDAG